MPRYIIRTPFVHVPTSAYAYVRRRLENCLMTLGLALLWVGGAKILFAILGITAETKSLVLPLTVQALLLSDTASAFLMANPVTLMFSAVVFAPVVEELVFRALPLTVFKGLPEGKFQVLMLVVCGVAFGMAHGHPFKIMVQGVVGVLFALLYLRNGPNRLVSYGSAVFVHSAYNFLVGVLSA